MGQDNRDGYAEVEASLRRRAVELWGEERAIGDGPGQPAPGGGARTIPYIEDAAMPGVDGRSGW